MHKSNHLLSGAGDIFKRMSKVGIGEEYKQNKYKIVKTWHICVSMTFPGFPDEIFKISLTFLRSNFRVSMSER